MNMVEHLDSSNFISGIFELDNVGTVLYSRFRKSDGLLDFTPQLAGQNFFDDVAGFENVREFHYKFRNFVSSNQFSNNFVFNCEFSQKTIPLRVMILRTSEINPSEKRDILIVDIRKNIY